MQYKPLTPTLLETNVLNEMRLQRTHIPRLNIQHA